MPSFSPETIEGWRQDRISDSKISKDTPSLKERIPIFLRVCEDDIREEEFRLNCALMEVKNCRSNLRSLKKKRESILKHKAEMEVGK